jgi:hypothetical protein
VNNNGRLLPATTKRASWIFLSLLRPSARTRQTTLFIFGTALLLVAIYVASSSIRTNNAQCLEAIAKDQHRSLEAFLRDPTLQGSLVQALEQCSR